MDYTRKTKEYVVAFIDVLDSKRKIQKDANGSLNVVHNAYESTVSLLDAFYKGEIEIFRPEMRIFSDNIIVAAPTDVKGKDVALMSVLICAGLIQHQFLHNKYLVRGGVTLGQFFQDDIMVWGDALVRAYEMESGVAIYPRIVLDPKMVAAVKVIGKPNLQSWIQQDEDGLFFVDYMRQGTFKGVETFLKLLIVRIEEAEKIFFEAGDDVKAQQKTLWHLSYIKKCLERYKK